MFKNTYGWYIFRRKLVSCVRYEQTSLTDGTITDDHTLDGLHVATANQILPTQSETERVPSNNQRVNRLEHGLTAHCLFTNQIRQVGKYR